MGQGPVRVCRHGLAVTRGLPGCTPFACLRVVLETLGGGHLGGGPSGSGEFAEVVAGEVEGPLDLGFDFAA